MSLRPPDRLLSPQVPWRRTIIVDGPLALKMRHVGLARAGARNADVLTLPMLAARLAGGFAQPATSDALYPAVAAALAAGGFAEIEQIRDLPGMIRAATRTLTNAWRVDFSFQDHRAQSQRIADLALVEARVRASLPSMWLIPPDLRSVALDKIEHAERLVGEVVVEGVLQVDPVWRPLVAALCGAGSLRWEAPAAADHGWFEGSFVATATPPAPAASADVCADPHAEAVEALRWARALLSQGAAEASDLAIAAADTGPLDEHLMVLARAAGLPLHFTHGLPALATREGQACASLADVLLRGLSQDRVVRVLRRSADAVDLPDDWWASLPPGALLSTVGHWCQALEEARPRKRSCHRCWTSSVAVLGSPARPASACCQAHP